VRTILILLTVLSYVGPAAAQPPARTPLNTTPVEMPLWDKGAPGALGATDADTPTLTIYRARSPVGTGIVVARAEGTPHSRWIMKDGRLRRSSTQWVSARSC
jgi:hypothetical protein